MDARDPAHNAAYYLGSDDDRIGDSIDNCSEIANRDQADSNGNGIEDLREIPAC